jgi:hypothetical protein
MSQKRQSGEKGRGTFCPASEDFIRIELAPEGSVLRKEQERGFGKFSGGKAGLADSKRF